MRNNKNKKYGCLDHGIYLKISDRLKNLKLNCFQII